MSKPYISEHTRREMAEFFQRTSLPRVLEERRKKAREAEQSDKAGTAASLPRSVSR